MCKFSNYSAEYYKSTELLRVSGIKPGIGYELLRKAIVMYYVENIIVSNLDKNHAPTLLRGKEQRDFLERLKEGMLIPNNKDVSKKIKRINRDPAMQWMIEALKGANIIKDQSDEQKKKDKINPENAVMKFIIAKAYEI